MRPSSQPPAGSSAAYASGRKPARSPCAIHFTGNSAAKLYIQPGISVYRMKMPEMNASVSAGRFITAAAERACVTRLDIATPSTPSTAKPSTVTQPTVSHLPGVAGSRTS
jgi:hypothetical protein